MFKCRSYYIEKKDVCKLIVLLLHYFYMMIYSKKRKIQGIIIFSIVMFLGATITIFSRIPKKGEVEGTQDDKVVIEGEVSDFNDIPVFKSEPPINGYVGEIYSYFVTVSDSDSVDLELSLLKGPLWLVADGLEVHGVPIQKTSMSGEKVILEISDGKNSSYQIFYLNIIER